MKITKKVKQRVMVFGVFDGLHAGHRAFLTAAKKRGTELIAVVARDEVVRLLKSKTPRRDEKARVRAIHESGLADRVVLGDKKQGTYRVIARYAPDSICLGYDQKMLAAHLRAHIRARAMFSLRMIHLRIYMPRTSVSSLRP